MEVHVFCLSLPGHLFWIYLSVYKNMENCFLALEYPGIWIQCAWIWLNCPENLNFTPGFFFLKMCGHRPSDHRRKIVIQVGNPENIESLSTLWICNCFLLLWLQSSYVFQFFTQPMKIFFLFEFLSACFKYFWLSHQYWLLL